VAGAYKYRIQVSTSSTFASFLVSEDSVSASTYTPPSAFPEGTIYWRVGSIDSLGNESSFSATSSLTIDLTPPIAPTPVAFTPDPTNNQQPKLDWNGPSDAARYHIQIDDNADFTSPLIDDSSLTVKAYTSSIKLPAGAIYWHVSSIDAAGNESAFSAPDSFVIDTTVPGVSGITATDQATGSTSFTNKRTINVALSGPSNSPTEMILAEDETFTTNSAGWIPYTSSTTYILSSGDGTKRVYVKVRNKASTESGYVYASITLDTTPPPVPTLTAYQPDPTSNTRPTLSWDNLSSSGAVKYHIQISVNSDFGTTFVDVDNLTANSYTHPLPLPETALYWRVGSIDAAGNESVFSAADSFTIDTTVPGIAAIILTNPTSGSRDFTKDQTVSVALSGTSSSSAQMILAENAGFTVNSTGWIAYSPTTSHTLTAGDGGKMVYAKVRDASGSESGYVSAGMVLDTASPINPSLSINGGAVATKSSSVTLALSATDATSGIHQTILSNDGVFDTEVWQTYVESLDWTLSSGDGTKTVYAKFRDRALNESPVASDSITLDTTPPAVPTLTAYAPDPTNNRRPALDWNDIAVASKYHIQISVSSAFSTFLVDDATLIVSDYDLSSDLPEGIVHWRVSSIDDVGNESSFSATDSFVVDTTPPIITGVSPSATQNNTTVTVTVVTNENAGVRWSTSNVGYAAMTNQFTSGEGTTIHSTTVTAATGSNTFYVSASDTLGNQMATAVAITFYVDVTIPDTAPPNIIFAGPGGILTTGSVILTVTTGENARVRWSTSNVGYASMSNQFTTGENTTAHSTTVIASEGDNTFYVSAEDTSANKMTTAVAISFAVDTTPPAVPVLTAYVPDPTNNRRPALDWNDVAGASRYSIQISTSSLFATFLVNDATLTVSSYIPSSDLPEGTIYWRVSSIDGVGNESSFSAADSFTIDATPPALPTLTAYTPDPTSNRKPTLDWNDVSGASKYRIQVSTGASFSTLLVNDATLTVSGYTPSSDLPEGTVYWRASSIDDVGNESSFPTADSFIVDVTPPSITGVGPSATQSNTTVTLIVITNENANVRWSTSNVGYAAMANQFTNGEGTTSHSTSVTATNGVSNTFYVNASDTLGNQMTTAVAITFYVDTSASDTTPPNIISVGPSGTLTTTSVTLTAITDENAMIRWSTSNVGYASMTNQFTTGEGTTTHSTTVMAAEGANTFYVSAEDTLSNKMTTAVAITFTVDTTPPAVPTLTAYTPDPTSNRRPALDWNDVAGASKYRIQVSTSSTFSTFLVNDATLTSSSYTPSSDLPEGTIYWRASSIDDAGNESSFPTADSFIIDATPPNVPTLTVYTPDPTNDNTPTLSWSNESASGAAKYRIQISAASDFSSFLVNDGNVTATSYTPSSALPEGVIYWRASSIDNVGNESSFPAADSFTIDIAAPTAPSMTAEPTYSAGTSNTISWTSVSGASEYYAESSTSSSFTSPTGSGWIATTSHTFSGLTDGQIYYYRVRAKDSALNESGWSNMVSSMQDNTPPISYVNALADPQTTTIFDVAYTASDGTSGVSYIRLFYRRNGESWTQYGGNYTSSPISFNTSTIGGDGFYEFYTIGFDNAGNQEAIPGSPDASTTVGTTVWPIITSLSQSYGTASATTITINGKNFGTIQGTSKVTFDTTDAAPGDYVSWSDIQIKVKVPSNATSGNVTVTVPSVGTSNGVGFIVWEVSVVDSSSDVGQYSDIALDGSGNPKISFYDATNKDLKYASWNGSTWSIQTVDGSGLVDAGQYTSLALDSSGNPRIAYYDLTLTSLDLKYASWNGSSWAIETADNGSLADVGQYASLALYGGNPRIAYYDATNKDLKYASWNGSSWDIQTVDGSGLVDVGQHTSLALDGSGNPRIAYYDLTLTSLDLKYASWNGSSWAIQTVDSTGDVGQYASLSLDGSGNPKIGYYDATNGDLKYASWNGSSWVIQTVDTTGDVGRYASLSLDGSGNPKIGYYDATNGDLRYATVRP
jgi:hypothetical protein